MLIELGVIILLFGLGVVGMGLFPRKSFHERVFYGAMTAYSSFIVFTWFFGQLIGAFLAFWTAYFIGIVLWAFVVAAFVGNIKVSIRKTPFIIPLIVLLLLLSHRFMNANVGVDWQDIEIIGSILAHGQVPPVNNWLAGADTVYPYGYHMFAAGLSYLSRPFMFPGEQAATVVNLVIPFFAGLLLLGVYILAEKILPGNKRAAVLAQVLSVSGSLAGMLLVAYLTTNPMPLTGDEGFWTLGKVAVPFISIPGRAAAHIPVADNIVSTGVLLPFPATYFLTGTALPFGFAFLVFAVCLLSDIVSADWDAVTLSAVLAVVLAAVFLIHPVISVMLTLGFALFIVLGVLWKVVDLDITMLYHSGIICPSLYDIMPAASFILSYILVLPRIMQLTPSPLLPYLDTYSLGVLALFYGPLLLFFGMWLHYRNGEKKSAFMVFSMVAASVLLVSSAFPLQQGIADRKYLVLSWFFVSVLGAAGLTEFMDRFQSNKTRVFVALLLVVGLMSPALMFANQFKTETPSADMPIGDFPAWKPGIQQYTFNGVAWVQKYYPEHYTALKWVMVNAPKHAVFIEAYRKDYWFKPIVPAMTGRQAVVGWYGYLEQQGQSTSAARQLTDDIYTSTAVYDAYLASHKTYIWVDETEKQRYNLTEIDRQPIYSNGGVNIFYGT